jgi:hypothetical protein
MRFIDGKQFFRPHRCRQKLPSRSKPCRRGVRTRGFQFVSPVNRTGSANIVCAFDHLENIYLPACRPSNPGNLVPHHPEGRPHSLAARKLDPRLDSSEPTRFRGRRVIEPSYVSARAVIASIEVSSSLTIEMFSDCVVEYSFSLFPQAVGTVERVYLRTVVRPDQLPAIGPKGRSERVRYDGKRAARLPRCRSGVHMVEHFG